MARYRLLAVLAAACSFLFISSALSQRAGEQLQVDSTGHSVENGNDADTVPAKVAGRTDAERNELLEDLLAAVDLALRQDPAILLDQRELELQLQLLDAAALTANDADRQRRQADVDATKQRIRRTRTNALYAMLLKAQEPQRVRVQYAQ